MYHCIGYWVLFPVPEPQVHRLRHLLHYSFIELRVFKQLGECIHLLHIALLGNLLECLGEDCRGEHSGISVLRLLLVVGALVAFDIAAFVEQVMLNAGLEVFFFEAVAAADFDAVIGYRCCLKLSLFTFHSQNGSTSILPDSVWKRSL